MFKSFVASSFEADEVRIVSKSILSVVAVMALMLTLGCRGYSYQVVYRVVLEPPDEFSELEIERAVAVVRAVSQSFSLIEAYRPDDPNPISHYDYDANGNRVGFSDFRGATPVVQNGTYDDQDRMVSYGTVDDTAEYTYSANGELESKTLNGEVTSYDYDVFGNLRGVDLPDETEIDYIVDGVGRRVGRS